MATRLPSPNVRAYPILQQYYSMESLNLFYIDYHTFNINSLAGSMTCFMIGGDYEAAMSFFVTEKFDIKILFEIGLCSD